MKILHIINSLSSGGAEKLIEETLPLYNQSNDIQVDVLLLTDQNAVFDKSLKSKGIKVDVIPLRQLRNPINFYYIRKYIVRGEYDIVHAHLFPTLYWVSIASIFMFKNKPKFIYTEHSTHNRRRHKKILQPLERFIYSNYDKVISISDSTQNNLIDWLKPEDNKLSKFIIINNGININKFKNARPYEKKEINSCFNNDTKLLCMVGRFSEAKDQDTIIKAMTTLPENIHLLLIGEGPLKSSSKELAIELGVTDRVHFLGFRNDVERLLKTSDIIIQSSNWEGFGLAAVEGMAAGKPVIASEIDGLREVVKGAGQLYKNGNVEDLVFKIIRLLENKNEYTEISNLCINKSVRYSIQKMVEENIKEYRELIN